MQLFASIIALELFGSTIAMALIIPDGATAALPSPKKWTISDEKMAFKGTIGGQYIETNGTIQDILADASAKYPALNLHSFTKTESYTRAVQDKNLERRQLHDSDAFLASHFCCPVPGQNWITTSRKYVLQNLSYLRDVDGWCGVGAGPGNCIRMAVSQDLDLGGCSFLYLCNDDPWSKNFDCGWIAYVTTNLIDSCPGPGYDATYTGGQQFVDTASHTGNGKFNVIVSRGTCDS